jgi:hypothetical protein
VLFPLDLNFNFLPMRKFIFIALVFLIIGHLLIFRLSSGRYGIIEVMGIIYPCTAELQNGYLNEQIIDTSNLKYAYFSLLKRTNEYSGLTCGFYKMDFNESSNIEGFKINIIDTLLYVDNNVLIKNDTVKHCRQYLEFPEFWWIYKEKVSLVNHGTCKGYLKENSLDRLDFKHPILYLDGDIDVVRTLNVRIIYALKISFIVCCILALYLTFIFIKSKFSKTS